MNMISRIAIEGARADDFYQRAEKFELNGANPLYGIAAADFPDRLAEFASALLVVLETVTEAETEGGDELNPKIKASALRGISMMMALAAFWSEEARRCPEPIAIEAPDDPAVTAYAQWRLVERSFKGDVDDAAEQAWLAESRRAEAAVVKADAITPAGLAAKLRLAADIMGGRYQSELIRQVIAALETQ